MLTLHFFLLLAFDFLDAAPGVVAAAFVAGEGACALVAAAGGAAFFAAGFAVCCGFFFGEAPEGDVAAIAGDFQFHGDWGGGVVVAVSAVTVAVAAAAAAAAWDRDWGGAGLGVVAGCFGGHVVVVAWWCGREIGVLAVVCVAARRAS